MVRTSPQGAPGDVALACTGLVKRYGDVVAVASVDLAVRRGECFGLLGPNGAGKTTTVEILEGLTAPDGGTVNVLGQRWGSRDDHRLRARLGVQLQETQLPDKLTVLEVLRLFASFYTSGREAPDVLADVELEEKRHARVAKLSGGQRQRLALACALVGEPEILFLDEPTTGLDPQARLNVWDIVDRFRARGGTVVLTTHNMDEAARLADRVAILDRGRVIALDTPARLVASLDADQIVECELGADVDAASFAALPGVRAADTAGTSLRLRVADIAQALPAVLAELVRVGVELVRMQTHQPTLEDVFVHLTGRGLRDE